MAKKFYKLNHSQSNAKQSDDSTVESNEEVVADENVVESIDDGQIVDEVPIAKEEPVVEEVKKQPDPEPVAPVVKKEEKVDEQVSTQDGRSEPAIYLDNIRTNGSQDQRNTLDAIERFVDRTRVRKPISNEAGAAAQEEFLAMMLHILNMDTEDFKQCWNVLLVYFLEHHGKVNTPSNYSTLSEYSAHRFRWLWSDSERLDAYTHLVTLLRKTCYAETRSQDIKGIMLDKISPVFVTGKPLENLQKFYKV